MKFPSARGPVSASLLDILRSPSDRTSEELLALSGLAEDAVAATASILTDEDLQLALFCLYELHYSGRDGADERWEWKPDLLAVRQDLEEVFETALRALVEIPSRDAETSDDVAAVLFGLTAADMRTLPVALHGQGGLPWTNCRNS